MAENGDQPSCIICQEAMQSSDYIFFTSCDHQNVIHKPPQSYQSLTESQRLAFMPNVVEVMNKQLHQLNHNIHYLIAQNMTLQQRVAKLEKNQNEESTQRLRSIKIEQLEFLRNTLIEEISIYKHKLMNRETKLIAVTEEIARLNTITQ